MTRRCTLALALVLTLGGSLASAGDLPAVGADSSAAQVRVNQVGYLVDDPKQAYVMTEAGADTSSAATYDVLRGSEVVASGGLGADVGAWSPAWSHVHLLDLSRLDEPGTYRVVLRGSLSGASPTFRIGTAQDLYAPLAANAVRFFQAQRDGSQLVPGVMRRKPTHLADRRAQIHRVPTYRNGRLVGALRPSAGRVDVSGGWFDAGDYLKFVETTSYADVLLLTAARDAKVAVPGLRAEALYGVRWLDKMWLDGAKRLLYQVGIGDGRPPRLIGDHDLWRLPQADDRLNVRPSSPRYYVKHRPALLAPERVSPNLAGRTAAAFALAAQLEARRHPRLARAMLRKARAVLGRARTTDVGRLLTTSPHAYYEEDEWRDDLELGATEIVLAAQALGATRRQVRADLSRAATWARAYVRSPQHGYYTLARDDQSAVAHADLIRAMDAAPRADVARLVVTRGRLVGDLAAQLRIARARYAAPLGYGGDEDPGADFTFGVAATERLYRRVSGDRSFASLGAGQRDWGLGTNAWGTSLVVGAGTTYPRCPHHQIANLLGSRPGMGPELLGAVGNGPAPSSELTGIGAPGDYARACPGSGANPFAAYDGQGVRYLDDVRAYAVTEPAIDYVAVSLLAFVLQGRGVPPQGGLQPVQNLPQPVEQ